MKSSHTCKAFCTTIAIMFFMAMVCGCGATNVEEPMEDTTQTTTEENNKESLPIEEEITEPEEEEAFLKTNCLPLNQTKDNLLQNVLITAGEYLDNTISSEKSYNLNISDGTYVIVAEVTLPTFTDEIEATKDNETLELSCKDSFSTNHDTDITKIRITADFNYGKYDYQCFAYQDQAMLFCTDHYADVDIDFICCVAIDPASGSSNLDFVDCYYSDYYNAATLEADKISSGDKFLFFYLLKDNNAIQSENINEELTDVENSVEELPDYSDEID